MRYVFKAAHFVIVIALAMPVAAQDFEAGLEAYESGDYAAALREIPALAAQDDADAQFNLGLKYAKGLGVARDYAEALSVMLPFYVPLPDRDPGTGGRMFKA